jgi:subtilisin family serine protease
MTGLPVRLRRSVAPLAALAAALLLVAVPGTVEAQTSEPNDPLWEDQWGPQQVRAHLAWGSATGAGSTIAIVDTGIDHDHEDLHAKVVGGTTFIEGCRSEEDRRSNDECDRDGDWLDGEDDGDAHGTHVAGSAAAMTDNGVGIAGVAPDADLLAVKVLDSTGSGTFQDVADGIIWSTDNGADVINLSLGGLQGYQVLAELGLLEDIVEAVEYANAQGVLVVAAAGNDAVPLCNEPAFRDGVVCVGATDRRELPAAYSSWPNKPDLIGVSAPGGSLVFLVCGEGILSTVPAGEGGDYCGYPSNLAYAEYDGTSMATPHVAGVGALVLEEGCTREQAIDVIVETARIPQTDLRGVWDPRYGYGIVDAEAAVELAAERCERTTPAEGDGGETEARGNRPDHAGPPGDRERPDRGNDRNRSATAPAAVPDIALLTSYLGSFHLGR